MSKAESRCELAVCFPAGRGGRKSRGQVLSLGDGCALLTELRNRTRGMQVTCNAAATRSTALKAAFPPGWDRVFSMTPSRSQGSPHAGVASPRAGRLQRAVLPAQRGASALPLPATLKSQALEPVKSEGRFLSQHMQFSALDCACTPCVWETAIPAAALGLGIRVGRSDAIRGPHCKDKQAIAPLLKTPHNHFTQARVPVASSLFYQ